MTIERRPEIIGLGKARGSVTITRKHTAENLADARDPGDREVSAKAYERLMRKVGVDERGWCAEGEAASDMASISIPQALEMAGTDITQVKSIAFATGLPDYLGVPTGTIVIKNLDGNRQTATADIAGACPGYIHALRTVYTDLSSPYGLGGPQIAVASEPVSKGINPKIPETYVLFGDASGAALLDLVDVDSSYPNAKFDYLIDPDYLEDLLVPAGGSKRAVDEEALRLRLNYIKMNGERVKEKAIQMMCLVVESVLGKAQLNLLQVDLVVPHQANLADIIKPLKKALNIPDEKLFINIEKYGNTSAASIPVAMREAWEQGKLKKGDIVLAITFGAGLNAAAAVLPMNGLPQNPNPQQ